MQGVGLIAAVPENIGFVVLCGAVVGLGVAVHYGVERPLLAGLRRRRRALDLRRVGFVEVDGNEKLRAMFAVR